ncbi:phage tail protein [Stackebrandtia soli]|uniref:phage tail protein n=1 Tax=Stackebrandtia soli TaxID=1892856 RepID=UPI0039EB9E99
MALDLGELSATIDANTKPFKRGLDEAELRMRGFQLDAQGRLRTLSGRFASEGEKAALGLKPVALGLDDIHKAANRLATVAGLGILASSAIHLGAALAPTVGIVAALPVAAGAAAVAVGALALSLDGVGDAIGAGLSGDVEAFNEALSELPASARSVVRELVSTFDGLQDEVQSAFFAPVAEEVDGLSEALSGPLRSGLSDVGGSLGGMAAEVAVFAQQGRTISQLTALFGGVGDAIDGAASGVQPLLRGVMDLIGAFVPGLGSVGQSIGDTMARWGEWMSEIASSGQAVTWVTTAREALAQLWSIGGNVVRTLGGIFGAADGSSVLDTIEQITASIATWVTSVEGQEQIASVLTLVSEVASDLLTILPGVASVIGGIANVFTALPGPIQSVVSGLLALGLAWKLLGITSMINAAKVAGAWLATRGAALGSAAVQLAQLALIGAKWVWAGAVSMANGLKMAAAWVIGLGPIAWVVAAVIAAVGLIIYYWDEIVTGLTAAWTWVSELAVTIWGGISAFFTEIWAGITATFTTAIDGIVNGLLWFAGLPGLAAEWFGGLLSGAIDAGASLLAWAGSLPGQVLGALGDVGGWLLDAGANVIDGLLSGMKNAAGAVMDWIWGLLSDMGDAVLEFFGIASPSRLMMGYGEFIGQGLAEGIRRSVSGVTAAATVMSTAAVPSFAPATVTPVAAYTPAAATVSLSDQDIGRLADAMTDRPITTSVQVDSREIARATDQGNRELAWGG